MSLLAKLLKSCLNTLAIGLGSMALCSCQKPDTIHLSQEFNIGVGLPNSPQDLPFHSDSTRNLTLRDQKVSAGVNQAWIFYNTVDTHHLNQPALFLGACLFINQVYWGPTKIADFQSSSFTNSAPITRQSNLIVIPPIETGQGLWLHVFRSPRTGFQPDCFEISVSSGEEALSQFLSFQMIETMTGVVLLFLCLMSILVYFAINQKNLMAFAALAFISGAFLLTSSHLFTFALGNAAWIKYLPTFFSLLIPSAAWNLIHSKILQKNKLVRVLVLFNLMPFFACGLFYWQNLSQEYCLLKEWTHVLFYPQFIFALILTISGSIQSASLSKIKIGGLAVLLIGTSLDFGSLLFSKPSYLWTCLAVLLSFALLLSYFTNFYVKKVQQSEINKSSKLSDFNRELIDTADQSTLTIDKKNNELERSNLELSRKNILLKISYKRMEDLISQKNELLKTAAEIDHFNLPRVLDHLSIFKNNHNKSTIHNLSIEIHKIVSQLEPVASLHRQAEALMGRTLWVIGPTQQLLFATKAALGGSGANIQAFTNTEDVLAKLLTHTPDMAIICSDMVSLAVSLHQQKPQISLLLISQVEISQHIDQLIKEPSICHILYQDDQDPIFSQKNTLVTSAKILSNDIFGLEKYLNWGVDVKEFIITSSTDRSFFLETLKAELLKAGIQSSHIRNATLIADELLMNAIYDAPIDRESGQSKYNHLSRRIVIDLGPKEYGKLRFAFDGSTIAISVEDPFGALKRDTIIRYLKSCFDGRFGSINVAEGKGGGGMGLFQIISTAHLMVTNIKPSEKTEIIALIHTATRIHTKRQHNSFHYFVERS